MQYCETSRNGDFGRTQPGFFEDFFDQKAKAVATFWRVVNHRLAAASAVA
jgi:hypothetical protein